MPSLTHKFADPDINAALEALLGIVHDHFQSRLLSVMLQGSIAFDDLCPGYSDFDFVAVINDEVTEADADYLIEIRKPFRAGEHGLYGQILEGPFLPYRMLIDPGANGFALCWGTRGDRRWEQNKLGWMALSVLRERGLVIWGQDLRHEIPVPTEKEMLFELGLGVDSALQHGAGGSLHSADWLLTAARELLWLKERRLSSKSEAADWGCQNARGEWRLLLPQAKLLRQQPQLADNANVQAWLANLTNPIQQAWREIRDSYLLLK
jgi:hypothetical protein